MTTVRTRCLPDFVCIGAGRCGTTTLWSLLRQHPRVYLPTTKELHFFDSRDGQWEQGIDWYSQHFAQTPPTMLTGESTPAYMFFDDAATRLLQTLPDARLLVVLRDPARRAWSQYWFNTRGGYESRRFEAAVEADRMTAERGGVYDSYDAARLSYISSGRFAPQLKRFGDARDAGRLHVMFFEDLISEPDPQMRGLCDFLGIEQRTEEWTLAELSQRDRNTGLSPRWRLAHTAYRRCSRWTRERRIEMPGLIRSVAKAVRKANLRAGIPKMSPQTHRDTLKHFEQSDHELTTWLGRELPWRAHGGTAA